MFDIEFEVQCHTEDFLKCRAEIEIKNKYIEIEDEVEWGLKEYEDLPPIIQDLSASNKMNASPALR